MQTTRVRSITIALLAALGCRGNQRSSPTDSGLAARPIATPDHASARRDWLVISWEPYAGVDPGDLGIGVAFLRRAEDKGAAMGTDTLLLRSVPDAAAPPVGALLFSVVENGVTRYSIAAADSLRPNLVEYGYEESGVPFDSTDTTARWVRGILGFASDGRSRVGWIDTGQQGVGLVRWAEQLADRPIFFLRQEQAAFFAAPDSGSSVPVPRGGADAYAIHPVEVRGPWLRARVVTPSDDCEPDSVPRQTRDVWIRYLDSRGRPNVWYYPRGC